MSDKFHNKNTSHVDFVLCRCKNYCYSLLAVDAIKSLVNNFGDEVIIYYYAEVAEYKTYNIRTHLYKAIH